VTDPRDFETETMARIYADQGHHDKAADIYRRLLARFPTRRDLQESLQRMERLQQKAADARLSAMLGEWVALLRKRRKLDTLQRLRHRRP
jgi:Lon protease-like protein